MVPVISYYTEAFSLSVMQYPSFNHLSLDSDLLPVLSICAHYPLSPLHTETGVDEWSVQWWCHFGSLQQRTGSEINTVIQQALVFTQRKQKGRRLFRKKREDGKFNPGTPTQPKWWVEASFKKHVKKKTQTNMKNYVNKAVGWGEKELRFAGIWSWPITNLDFFDLRMCWLWGL